MAAYFEDGVAFIRSTDVATSPDGVQLLRERRGLLSTHAVVPVGDQEHFGIFDDGWFFLDPSGRWTEAGVAEIDGIRVRKWKETFYGGLDVESRHRMYTEYDGNFIRIIYPKSGDTETEEVWTYDPRGNRVYTNRYPAISFGLIETQIRAGVTWANLSAEALPGGTWGELDKSWAGLGAKFGLKSLSHGTTTGYVLAHDYNLITQYDTVAAAAVNPSFQYASHLSSLGDPTVLKNGGRLWVEYIQTGTGPVTLRIDGDTSEGFESGSVDMDASGAIGDINTIYRDFNFTSANLKFTVSGTSPVLIRSFRLEATASQGEERKG